MSPTPAYGETPLGSDPEQPEWLRKASGNPTGPTYPQQPPPQSPYQGAPQTQNPAQHQGYGQYQGHTQHQAPDPAPRPGAYPPPGSPWGRVDPHAKSRLVAGLLGIFLGAFGIHRFYLGYTGVGVTMLFMTLLTCGFLAVVTSIWGLVEGVLYLTDKTGRYSRDKSGRPLRD